MGHAINYLCGDRAGCRYPLVRRGRVENTRRVEMPINEEIRFKPYTRQTINQAPEWSKLTPDQQEAIDVVGRVLPFRINHYVLCQLIDWDRVPDDPIFRLTFPHRDMLAESEYDKLRDLIANGNKQLEVDRLINEIRLRMKPHPGGQVTHNVPYLNGVPLPGMQHKYRETVLLFPSAGQSCHAYCTFCFRWPQFVGMDKFKFNPRETTQLVDYLTCHRDVTDVLITGGDPLVMNARSLSEYLKPLLSPELSHIQNVRIGTKSVAYWPHRFVSDKDTDDLLRVFESVVSSGRNLAIMGHYNHPNELEPEIAQQAVRRIIGSGATVRMQAPLVRHINTDPDSWVRLWTLGVKLGAVPYYMFVERDTGPRDYFKLPLADAYEIFRRAYCQVSGLARTVRGPSMSAFPGKVVIDGIVEIAGEKLFALHFLQARNPEWVRRPFYAKFDPHATWLDDLVPAFGASRFFFESNDTTLRDERSVMPLKILDELSVSADDLAEQLEAAQ
jgi:KamA family protein